MVSFLDPFVSYEKNGTQLLALNSQQFIFFVTCELAQ
jgi:hypothetical protein